MSKRVVVLLVEVEGFSVIVDCRLCFGFGFGWCMMTVFAVMTVMAEAMVTEAVLTEPKEVDVLDKCVKIVD